MAEQHMLYNISFDIAGLILIASVLLIHRVTYRFYSKNNHIFRIFLYFSLLNGITSIVTSYTISYSMLIPDWLNMLLNVLYQISACYTAFFGLKYVMACFHIQRRIDWIVDMVGASFYVIILLINIRYPIMFSFQNHEYIRGPLYRISYYIQSYFVLHGAVVMLLNRKSFAGKQLYLNTFYVTIPVTAGIIQLFYPGLLLTYFGGAVAALFMIFSLETTDYQNLQKAMAELELARSQATEANRIKSEFLARMSHEIRTPINGILGMNTMVRKENCDPVIAGYVDSIDSAGHALLALINDILDLSKVESGRMELVETSYQLSSLINDCYHMVATQARDKGLSLTVELDPDLPCTLKGDEVRVRQIIVNLLNNSVKYTDRGCVILSVSGRHPEKREELSEIEPQAEGEGIQGSGRGDDGGAKMIELVISVIDTGIGIRDDQIDKIFSDFQRLDEPLNRNIEGSGLGLPIAGRLVDLMGGHIGVESEFGKGSVFTVSIPQQIVDEQAVGSIKIRQNGEPEMILYAPSLRILAVDDVELNLKVACGFLKESDAYVDTAKSGLDCLRKVKKNRYDIILMDHMMPDMSGIETYRRMRNGEYEINKDTPVIMMTANAIVGAREDYLKEGFADYLSKPLTQAQLFRCIAAHVDPGLYEWRNPEEFRKKKTADGMANGSAVPADGMANGSAMPADGMANGSGMSADRMANGSGMPADGMSNAAAVPVYNSTQTLTMPLKGTASTAPPAFNGIPAGGFTLEQPDHFGEDPSMAVWAERLSFLDLEYALPYCGSNMDFYIELVRDYVAEDRTEAIEDAYQKEDWTAYEVQVHALKSSSKLIGAMELAELALKQELSAKEGDISLLKEGHDRCMEAYAQLRKRAAGALEADQA